jgi:NDP-sugar pyrophosphorylase family protein
VKALVLAAGKAKRLRPLQGDIPKPMLKVSGKPVLEHIIEHLSISGIRDIIINLHYLPDIIREYFKGGEKWGVSIEYSFEPKLLGTAGAARKVADKLGEDFLVYYGDNLCSCDLVKLQRFHREKGGIVTIVISESYDDLAGGVVECDPDGRLTRFLEKPPLSKPGQRWENGGIYILKKSVLSYVPEGRPSDFGKDIFLRILKNNGIIYCYKAEGYVRGVDTPERYKQLLNEIEKGSLKLR